MRARMQRVLSYRFAIICVAFAVLVASGGLVRSAHPRTVEAAGGRTEIRTGGMLGEEFNPRWLYTRTNGGAWQPTYPGSALAGRLMNFRAANAIFDDENRADDDPQANTNAFISNLDAYKQHGILAFTIGLQGGNPGYEGALASAFNPDGSIKSAWMARAAQVIEAADSRGQIVILSYFYYKQDQVLRDAAAVKQAVKNATDWLIANNYRNVIIEVANEHNLSQFEHPLIRNNATTNGIGELVLLAKSRFDGKGWRPPVSASHTDLVFPTALRATGDLALPHGNKVDDWQTGEDTYPLVKAIVDAIAVPVVMNEDDGGAKPSQLLLDNDTHAMDDVLLAGGSWGMNYALYHQHYPFRWSLGDPTKITTSDGYFHAILDQIQARVGTVAVETPTPVVSPTPPPTASPTPTRTPNATPTATSTPTLPPTGGTPYNLVYSLASTRSNAVALNNATVTGVVYIFTTPDAGVEDVEFYLDGAYIGTEGNAPFDLKGGTVSAAKGWNSATVQDGNHQIQAVLRLTDGSTVTVNAQLTVANQSLTVSGVAATNTTSDSATITWTTSLPATSQVEYGTSATYGMTTTVNTAQVTDHAVQLSGLTPATNYYYRVISQDGSGRTTFSNTFTFATEAIVQTTVSISGVQLGQALRGVIVIEALVSEPNIASVEFQLTGPVGVTWVERSPRYYFMGNDNSGPHGWKTTDHPDGAYALVVTAIDGQAQSHEARVSFTIDNVP